jgi:hypothetical protein
VESHDLEGLAMKEKGRKIEKRNVDGEERKKRK